MSSNISKVDIPDVLQRHQARYEVHSFYVASPSGKKVQAGFDVDLYGNLETWHLPLYSSEEGHRVVDYFESVAQEIQSNVGHDCTVEVIRDSDSLILDTQHHFRPEAMLRIRISHDRGLDQPAGPAEEQALNAIRETLHELKVREA
jgi:hypothetical protein